MHVANDSPETFVALTTCPLTRPCAEAARRLLSAHGQRVRLYAADGTGGRQMESDVLAGRVAGVLDVSLAELAAELVGGPGGAGPDRLTAAALRGVPQVIVLGALDVVAVEGSRQRGDTAEFAGVRYRRTTPEECDQLGKEIAHKASAARGPTVILVPRRGLSELDAAGRPCWRPEADAALVQSLHNWISPRVRVRPLDLHVNDPAFAAAAVVALEELANL